MWSKMEHKQIPLFLLKDSVSSGANAHGHYVFTASPGLSGPHMEISIPTVMLQPAYWFICTALLAEATIHGR